MGLLPAHGGLTGWLCGLMLVTFALALVLRALDRRLRAEPEPLAAELRVRRVLFGTGLWVLLAIMAVNAGAGPLAYRGSAGSEFDAAIGWLTRSLTLWLPLGTLLGGWVARRVRRGGSARALGWLLGATAAAVVVFDFAWVLRDLERL